MSDVKKGMACGLLLLGMARLLAAQDLPLTDVERSNAQTVFAYQGQAVLTQAALDGAFSRIPEEYRLMFIRDGAKVDKLVKNLLQAEVVARDAEKSGFSQDAVVQQRVLLAARKELAEAWLEELVKRAPAADYAAMAKEDYLAHPEAYSNPATVDVTHILIGTDKRPPGEAEAIALELLARLEQDPGQFDALVLEYSDDPGKADNSGKYLQMKRGQMVKPFEEAAFALQTVGEITAPVETEYGFHLIRLDQKHEPVPQPFNRVKAQAVEKMKAKYIADYRTRYLQKLLQDPIAFPEGSVEVMARRYFGENLEKAPIFTEDGIKTGAE
jgi:peptidyl-prolyl cis-trans isomerase C